ncbi:MAG: heme ABC exporter ATP-binding protein CcmA [Acidimicrobiaceae bacterium]|nr:heme ABC exporter ATP-binding protein CcmA [Acidimicrobiaceae bacterium]MYH00962.1 heme ABC exporter ATP-binding protein CcmA [Acidimicrobiaceae bacterium]MYL03319.1 heme ABC exporter ATP-binding protein CcmA [Acidimicrobiaceae bacterium]
MSAVRLAGAVVLLGRFPALAGADLSVDPGEVVLVRGPNGAGKSTLLHLCAGLLPLSEGRGEVLGCDLGADRAAVRRRVGLLGHDTALYGELSPAENLDLWARASRVDAAVVPGVLGRLGVPERLWAVPSTRLSAGQRRRVALAAIVVRRPELWLLDEPHAGLDGEGRALVSGLLSEAASAGAAVVLASHETGPADDLATRMVTMAGGTVGVDAV